MTCVQIEHATIIIIRLLATVTNGSIDSVFILTQKNIGISLLHHVQQFYGSPNGKYVPTLTVGMQYV